MKGAKVSEMVKKTISHKKKEEQMKQSKKELEDMKERLKGKKLFFACCFCPKEINVIADREDYGRDEYATIVIEKTGQNYWCHVSCLKKRLRKLCKDELA